MSSSLNDWNMVYLGNSKLIPTMDGMVDQINKQGAAQAHLYKEKGDYKEFRTKTISLPPPFDGRAYLSIAYVDGEVVPYRL